MKKVCFRVVLSGLTASPRTGLVFYRSDRPLPAENAGSYRPAPGSDVEYARVAFRPAVSNRQASEDVTLEVTSGDEGEVPAAVYSCVVTCADGSQTFLFDGLSVPASLSEQTTYAALLVANQPSGSRRISIQEAEQLRPEAGL
jgi:hypothetical protein